MTELELNKAVAEYKILLEYQNISGLFKAYAFVLFSDGQPNWDGDIGHDYEAFNKNPRRAR